MCLSPSLKRFISKLTKTLWSLRPQSPRVDFSGSVYKGRRVKKGEEHYTSLWRGKKKVFFCFISSWAKTLAESLAQAV